MIGLPLFHFNACFRSLFLVVNSDPSLEDFVVVQNQLVQVFVHLRDCVPLVRRDAFGLDAQRMQNYSHSQ